ncbi:uncharacterized protein LOC105920972 isoform X2 [Fundulus heteroclitus]|uniref:uncharacterized protein LOC105920972 isoform X2 n=1 Tax=Fundulus heteroclitus TaxID=8078 RepID=UPI00165AD3F3|nr:uncharacterized protein LOC105920972 isoform X2 [Fundulus heteroclitus]
MEAKALTCSAKFIPSGRQLPRTPPMTSVMRHLNFDDADGEFVMPKISAKGDLAETQAFLKNAMNALELALASREVMLVSFNKYPSNEKLSKWAKLALGNASPLDLAELDTKSLLAMVTMEKIQSFTDQKKKAIAQMEETIAEKCKKEAEDRSHHKIQVSTEELKIQELMGQLTNANLDIFQQETNAEKPEDSEKLQVAKSKPRCSKNQREALKMGENTETNCKSRKTNNKGMSGKCSGSVKEMLQQKSVAVTREPLKHVKATRERRQQINPLSPLQAGLRRSKRIANRT